MKCIKRIRYANTRYRITFDQERFSHLSKVQIMKKNLLLLLPILLLFARGYAADPVNEVVLKIFQSSFKEAKEVSWFESKDQYTVHFVKDDIRYNVIYDKKGRFISSRRYYLADRLPLYILFKVKNRFTGKSIYGVTETMDDSGVTYYITLEDDKDWWVVKVTSQEFMEITSKLLKNK